MSERLAGLEHAQAQPRNEATSQGLRGDGDFLKRLRVGQVILLSPLYTVANVHTDFVFLDFALSAYNRFLDTANVPQTISPAEHLLWN